MTMKKMLLAATAALLLAVPLVGNAQADSGSGSSGSGGDDVTIRRGVCSAGATWKLKGKPDDGRLEVEWEVDSNRVGQTWNFTIRDNGTIVAQGTRTTLAPSGSFEVERRIPDLAGPDVIVARATHPASGQTCRGSITL
jgi:hypothetical protein